MILAGKLHIVHVDRWAHSCTCCERNVDLFEGVGLHAPLVEPGVECVEVGLELLESYGWVTVRCENLVISCKISFPSVGLKITSLPTLSSKCPNKVLTRCLENLSKTGSNSS
jgi:hypothetical protein